MTIPDDPRSRPWFAVKSHGYGAGLPIRWQGWVSLAVFMILALGLPLMLDPWIGIAIIGLLAVGFVRLAQRKSNDVWRWRWGERD